MKIFSQSIHLNSDAKNKEVNVYELSEENYIIKTVLRDHHSTLIATVYIWWTICVTLHWFTCCNQVKYEALQIYFLF